MSKPDSLLTAAKRLADAAGRPWAEVQPYYKALQEQAGEDLIAWLPKSIGRNIWSAHPNFITRLLVAVTAAGKPSAAHDAISWVYDTTPGGRERYLSEKPAAGIVPPIEREFYGYLVDAEAARDLVSVEFQPDLGRVVFDTKSRGPVTFARPYNTGDDAPALFRGIYSRGVINGDVFVSLAQSTAWRLADQAPFEAAKANDLGDDA